MPKLAITGLEQLNTLDPSGRLLDIIKQLEASHNNLGQQVNAAPVGTTQPPSKINAVVAEVLTAGVHQVTITDDTPVSRGIHYIAEASPTKDFLPGQVYVSPPSASRTIIVPTGAGKLFWRAYSQYPTSAPSDPVYAPTPIDALGTARTAPLRGTGSGTEPSLNPQAGAGFGFTPERVPRVPGE